VDQRKSFSFSTITSTGGGGAGITSCSSWTWKYQGVQVVEQEVQMGSGHRYWRSRKYTTIKSLHKEMDGISQFRVPGEL
jgi:phosphoribulokinase